MTDKTAPVIQIAVPAEVIKAFCERYHIRKLSLFGSVLRNDFNADSDVDVLVEFKPETRVGLFDLAHMARELSKIFGRKVDLLTPGFLSQHFRQQVLDTAETIYEAAS